MKAYEYSMDIKLVHFFVSLMQQVLTQRYIHPTRPEWNGWYEYKGGPRAASIDHEAIIYYVPALMFIKAVRGDPELQKIYGHEAETWLRDVDASIRAWDRRGCWHDLPGSQGWYTFLTEYSDPTTGELRKVEHAYAGGTVPYNKVSALFPALSLAYQITGDAWYRERMEKLSRFFREHWRVDSLHAEWNYSDHEFPGDFTGGGIGKGDPRTGIFVHPNGRYYLLDLTAIIEAYDLGICYARRDIEKLIQTNLEYMRWVREIPDDQWGLGSEYLQRRVALDAPGPL